MKSKRVNFNTIFFSISIFSILLSGCEKNKLPTCVITSPGDGVEIVQGETVTITVSANDIGGSVSEVRFYIDGSDIGSATSSPYNFDWETSGFGIGSHLVEAVAEDNSGNFASDKIEISLIPAEAGTVTDFDGNTYNTVKIGNQWWMSENLKTTHYANGDVIPDGTEAGVISEETDPEYWFAYDDDLNNVSTYGRLYTWYTVTNSRNVCPDGWHVPGDTEWTQLTDHLGGVSVAGGKLKEAGTTHWSSPNNGATNESGFTGLPGGSRASGTGSFGTLGEIGHFWTATEDDSKSAWNQMLVHSGARMTQYSTSKSHGFSVRCLKDN